MKKKTLTVERIVNLTSMNKCVNCEKENDVMNYHIPLCKKCRLEYLEDSNGNI